MKHAKKSNKNSNKKKEPGYQKKRKKTCCAYPERRKRSQKKRRRFVTHDPLRPLFILQFLGRLASSVCIICRSCHEFVSLSLSLSLPLFRTEVSNSGGTTMNIVVRMAGVEDAVISVERDDSVSQLLDRIADSHALPRGTFAAEWDGGVLEHAAGEAAVSQTGLSTFDAVVVRMAPAELAAHLLRQAGLREWDVTEERLSDELRAGTALGPLLLQTGRVTGADALCSFALAGDAEACEAALAAGVPAASQGDGPHGTALQCALHGCHWGLAERLVEAGADVRQASDAGTTPLTGLVRHCGGGTSAAHLRRQVRFLRERGVDVNDADATGRTPAAWAVLRNSVEALVVLVEEGAGVGAASPLTGTLLFAALGQGRVECASALIRAGADVNAPSLQGETPLLQAAMLEKPRVVRELLAAGARVEVGDGHGDTPLSRALGAGRHETAQVLVQHGAVLTKRCVMRKERAEQVVVWPTKRRGPKSTEA